MEPKDQTLEEKLAEKTTFEVDQKVKSAYTHEHVAPEMPFDDLKSKIAIDNEEFEWFADAGEHMDRVIIIS